MSARVCILTETYHPVTGGGETQARVLAAGFAAAGSTVHVLTRRTDSALPKSESLDGATIIRLSPSGPGHLKKWGLVASAFVKLVQLRESYDLILVCGYRVMGIPSVIVGKLLGKPCILKADSIGELSGEFFDPGLRRFKLNHSKFPISIILALRNRLLRRSSAFIAISTVIADELLENKVIDARIFKIPNSVNTTRFFPVSEQDKLALRDSLGVPRDIKIGIYTGRLDSSKGLPLLLRSWANISDDYKNKALLLLVGAGGIGLANCEDELRKFVNDNALEKRVIFAGSVANVDEYLKASDFFILPTLREAFGISIIEALACGLPVITTTTGGVRDIVTDSENAIVVPVNDEQALQCAIDKVLHDGQAVKAMGENGRKTVIERYAEQQVLLQYRTLIEGLFGNDSHE